MRNLRIIGLALVAAFAISAALASTASAEFTAENDGTTTLTSKALTKQVFEVGASKVSCEEVTLDNMSIVGTVQNEITAEPTYSGNCIVEPSKMVVDMNGCHYLLTTTATSNFHILCPAGKQIEWTAEILGSLRPCMNIHAQTPTTATVNYINGINPATNKVDITINSTVEGITYEKTGLCQGGTNEANNAKLTGEVTVTGADSVTGAAVSIIKSKHF